MRAREGEKVLLAVDWWSHHHHHHLSFMYLSPFTTFSYAPSASPHLYRHHHCLFLWNYLPLSLFIDNDDDDQQFILSRGENDDEDGEENIFLPCLFYLHFLLVGKWYIKKMKEEKWMNELLLWEMMMMSPEDFNCCKKERERKEEDRKTELWGWGGFSMECFSISMKIRSSIDVE